MKVRKKVIGNLEKCYSLARLTYRGTEHFLAAAEKQNACYLYDLDGNYEETVWEGPGGVMTMVQVPGTDGQFLATRKFYSPNDSCEASLVVVTPRGSGRWEVNTLVKLPFVHRFDILERGGTKYLIACTLKSGHAYKEDWRSPGKVYAARLPDDLSGYNDSRQLELEVIQEGMDRNHGYYRKEADQAVISCSQGVYLFRAPRSPGEGWEIRHLLDVPASDALLLDLDEDGKEELAVISPFHGDTFSIYKEWGDTFERIYTYPQKLEFLHAIYGGELCRRPGLVIGHRKGARLLLAIRSDRRGSYKCQILDSGRGAANVLHYCKDGRDYLIAANRETDEIAMYTLEEEGGGDV